MKVKQLKLLFSAEIEKIKANKEPTTRYIVRAYKRVLNEINTLNDEENITNEKILNLDITKHMKEKLIFFSKKRIPKNMIPSKLEKLKIDLDSLIGIGSKKADELISHGLKNINQLHQKKWFDKLNKDTQMMLNLKPIRRISHIDILKIEHILIGFKHPKVKFIQLVGSFRRKRPYSKDIDILFCSKNNETLDDYIKYLKGKFKNHVYLYSKGLDKISLIIQPFLEKDIRYKVDIFRSDPDNYFANLLYSTGPKEFNIKMRARAKKMGYLLNQNGLFKDDKKINLPNDNERRLFEYLNMEYLTPPNRT